MSTGNPSASALMAICTSSHSRPRTASTRPSFPHMLIRSPRTYGDEKVANRDIRVWHFVIENGY
jgi:hypothetical protein